MVEGTYVAVVPAEGAILLVAYTPLLLRSEVYDGGVGEEDKSDEEELLPEEVRDSDETFG